MLDTEDKERMRQDGGQQGGGEAGGGHCKRQAGPSAAQAPTSAESSLTGEPPGTGATSVSPLDRWSHLVFAHDGVQHTCCLPLSSDLMFGVAAGDGRGTWRLRGFWGLDREHCPGGCPPYVGS